MSPASMLSPMGRAVLQEVTTVRPLSYQITVNTILLAAGYHSAESGLLSHADLDRMDEAREAGQTPQGFAQEILDAARCPSEGDIAP